MTKTLKNEKEVLKSLNLSDFRHLTKDKIAQFVSFIPNMPKEVALKCIEQFPEFAKQTGEVITAIKNTATEILKYADSSQKDTVKAYMKNLDILEEQIKYASNTFEERMIIADKITVICDKLEEINKEHKAFLGKVLTTVGFVLLGAAAATVKVITGGRVDIS